MASTAPLADREPGAGRGYDGTKDQAVASSRTMFVRHIAVGLLSLAGSSVLIRDLGPALWASYGVAYFLTAFVDVVFGANVLGSLVRSPAEPDRRRKEAAAGVMQ